MMNGLEKSDPVIVATKLANKADRPSVDQSARGPYAAELVEGRAGTKGNAGQQARTGHRAGQACHRRWAAYGKRLASPSHTRGGSRMRESRSYGSVRGAESNLRPYRYSLRAFPLMDPNRTCE